MTMLIATRDIPTEDVTAGKTRIAPDHPLASSHASAFAPAAPLPPFGKQSEIRTTHPTTGRVVAERDPTRQSHERNVIATRMREIEREDRLRESSANTHERPETRRERRFWAETQRLLDAQREPEERTPALYDIDYLLSAEEQAELDAIDADWGKDAPWN
jgi:hypothetical protein